MLELEIIQAKGVKSLLYVVGSCQILQLNGGEAVMRTQKSEPLTQERGLEIEFKEKAGQNMLFRCHVRPDKGTDLFTCEWPHLSPYPPIFPCFFLHKSPCSPHLVPPLNTP